MADQESQTYENHAKFVPLYHYVLAPILLINVTWSGYVLVGSLTIATAIDFLVALGLVFLFLFARVFALGAQDRVIRLEERMRLQQLLPDELKPRIKEFSSKQLIAMRFASDSELSNLAHKILENNMSTQKEIKESIKEWKADYQRL